MRFMHIAFLTYCDLGGPILNVILISNMYYAFLRHRVNRRSTILMPRVRGSLKITDSTAHATSRLECEFGTEKFKPFIRTASSESLRTYLERLRMNFLEDVGVYKTLFC
jgi:hypothetical protein